MSRFASLILLACAVLAGCDTAKIKDISFDGRDAQFGLVVFGIAAEPGYQGLDELLGWHVRWDQWPTLTADQLAAERGNLSRAEAQKLIDDGATGLFANRPPSQVDLAGDTEPRMDQVRYYIRPAMDRTYYLREVRVIRRQSTRPVTFDTSFAPDNNAPNFRIKPGEVVYIGNFHFELTRGYPQRSNLVRIDADEVAARAYIAQHPKIRVPMTTRLWSGSPTSQ